MEELRRVGLPLKKENWLTLAFSGPVPDNWEQLVDMPEEIQALEPGEEYQVKRKAAARKQRSSSRALSVVAAQRWPKRLAGVLGRRERGQPMLSLMADRLQM